MNQKSLKGGSLSSSVLEADDEDLPYPYQVSKAHITGPILLEGGSSLPEVEIEYHTYGTLNPARNNVIWVCHALTANAAVHEWWPGIIGPGKLLDTDTHFVVCANILGSCYGTTGPLSVNADTQEPYYHSFPDTTIRDVVQLHRLLAQYLGITEIGLLIGGSLGGMQAMEWAIEDPYYIRQLVLVATSAKQSAWATAYNEAQRLAIESDATWKQSNAHAGLAGLKAARAIALLSYRNHRIYGATQTDDEVDTIWPQKAVSYQQYQGEKLVKRFNAFSYHTITKIMDSHNVGRTRGGVPSALARIQADTLVIGIKSDVLFPTDEQKLLARLIPEARFVEFESHFGHDGFLTEVEKITVCVREFQRSLSKPVFKKNIPETAFA